MIQILIYDAKVMQKKNQNQTGWCYKPIELSFESILNTEFCCYENRTNQLKSTIEPCLLLVPSGKYGPPLVTLTKCLKLKTRLLLTEIHRLKDASYVRLEQ